MIGDVNGSACPKCACCHTTVIDEVIAFGKRTERLCCRHCGHRFCPEIANAIESDESETTYRPRCLCPKCAAADPSVQRTMKKGTATIRYHRCECGHRFRSVESGAG